MTSVLGASLNWFRRCACVALIGLSLGVSAQYESGVHYIELPTPLSVSSDGVEITEYFSYACNHCYQFEPSLAAWVAKLPEDVTFTRTPAMWNDTYRFFAQTYYTLRAMDVLDKMHLQVFNAVHLERRNIMNPKAMAEFLAELGVDAITFGKVFTSFGVQASLQQTEARGLAYRATGVPTLIVNGKYRVESRGAGGTSGMLKVAEYLINLEKQ